MPIAFQGDAMLSTRENKGQDMDSKAVTQVGRTSSVLSSHSCCDTNERCLRSVPDSGISASVEEWRTKNKDRIILSQDALDNQTQWMSLQVGHMYQNHCEDGTSTVNSAAP